jgi:hypothetical protein
MRAPCSVAAADLEDLVLRAAREEADLDRLTGAGPVLAVEPLPGIHQPLEVDPAPTGLTGSRPPSRAGARTAASRPRSSRGSTPSLGTGSRAAGPSVVASTWRATVTLCTSVGPSAMPMTRPRGSSRERHLVGGAERAVHLHRAPGDVVQHLRHRDLHGRDVLAHLACSRCACRSATRCAAPAAGTARSGSTSRRSSLHELLVGEQARPGSARQGALAHHVERLRPCRWCAWRGGCGRRRGGSGRWRTPGPRRRAGVGRHAHVLVADVGVMPSPIGSPPRGRRCGRSRRPACRPGRGTSTCPGTGSRRGR